MLRRIVCVQLYSCNHPQLSVAVRGCPWLSVAVRGCPWRPWLSVAVRGCPWLSVAGPWLSVAVRGVRGCPWLSVAVRGTRGTRADRYPRANQNRGSVLYFCSTDHCWELLCDCHGDHQPWLVGLMGKGSGPRGLAVSLGAALLRENLRCARSVRPHQDFYYLRPKRDELSRALRT